MGVHVEGGRKRREMGSAHCETFLSPKLASAANAREKFADGVDLLAARERTKVMTFGEADAFPKVSRALGGMRSTARNGR
jgi:hypothetical protein